MLKPYDPYFENNGIQITEPISSGQTAENLSSEKKNHNYVGLILLISVGILITFTYLCERIKQKNRRYFESKDLREENKKLSENIKSPCNYS